jgi:hypothetical protein
MTAIERFREFWPRDRVFDFLIPEMPPDLDVTHGVILYLERKKLFPRRFPFPRRKAMAGSMEEKT